MDVAFEREVELLSRDVERVLVDIAAAADDCLAQREEELPDTLLAPPILDELERRVTQVVDQPGVRELTTADELAHRGQGVRERRVTDRHQVERIPDAGHVVGQPFVDPERGLLAEERPRDDVERELVRQLVGNQPIQQVGRLIDRQQDPHTERLGECGDPVGDGSRADVLLFELAVGLEDDHLDSVGQVVRQIGADLSVGALGVARDPRQVLFQLGVVVDLEVVRLVDVPIEVVILHQVLPIVRVELVALGRRLGGPADREQPDEPGDRPVAIDSAPVMGAAHDSPRERPAAY